MILVQFVANISSCRHDSLPIHIRHTDSLESHQERLEKNAYFLILLRNFVFFYMEINYSM